MMHFDFTLRDARKIVTTLVLGEVAIVSVYLFSFWLGKPSYTLQVLFDLDGEACIPAWLSSMQLFLVGVLLLVASSVCCRISSLGLFLKLAGAGFLYISADEASMIHERIGAILRSLPYIPMINGHGAWISLYLAGGAIFLLATRHHLIALWNTFRHESIVALTGVGVFLLGALGFEMLGDLLRTGTKLPETPLYVLEVAMEEFCEMFGVSIILYGVMQFVLQITQDRQVVAQPDYRFLQILSSFAPATTASVADDVPILPAAINQQQPLGDGRNLHA